MDAKRIAEQALTEARNYEAGRLREVNERLAEALEGERRARGDAETASTLKDEFLMTLSHELRTPLTAIQGWAHMLAAGELDDRRRQTAIETIDRNARAQTRLVNDLLDVSQAITGKLRLEVRDVDLVALVRAGVETLRPAADAKRIRVEADIAPGRFVVRGDPDRLQQVVWNLLSNAIKFTPSGGSVACTAATRRGRRRRRFDRLGYRDRDHARVPAACVRALPPGRSGHDPAVRRPRPRPRDCASHRRAARRVGAGGERWRCTGIDLPRAAADETDRIIERGALTAGSAVSPMAKAALRTPRS